MNLSVCASTKKRISSSRLATAIHEISGIDEEVYFFRREPGREDLRPKKGNLVISQTPDTRNGCFRNWLTVGSIYMEFNMPSAEFGPKLAVALGEEVLFDDDLDESDSEEYPFYVATPDGKRHRAHYDESGEIVY